MTRRFFACTLIALGCAQPTATSSPTHNAPRKDIVIQFTDMSLNPETAEVLQGGSVTWDNLSANYSGVVVFPVGTEQHFTCKELRPNFNVTATGITSLAVDQDSLALALPCPLEPGEYSYVVNLFSGGQFQSGAGMGNPQLTLPGKLIVK